MVASIKSIMDQHGSNVKITPAFLKRVHQYRVHFANKNEDHARFFGGNLYGVYPVRFLTSDRLEWTDEIMQLDEYAVRQDIVKLPDIKEQWVRVTDTMNVSCMWLLHKIHNDNSLSHVVKEQAMVDVLLVFQYKLLTSLMTHYFKYPTDEATALALYASLSKKFALKQYGTWQRMLEARCMDIIDKSSIHYRTIERFDDDVAIVNMITDIQGRLRAVMKKLYLVFIRIRETNARILSTSGTVEVEGKMVVKDMARNMTKYKRYLNDVMLDRNRFIKNELVVVIGSAMHTLPEKLLSETLEYITVTAGTAQGKVIDQLADETLLHAFNFLIKDRAAFERSNDITALITKLRAIYMSSRSTDPSLMLMRELSEKIVLKAVKTRNPSTVASIRTGLCLYLVLRTFAMKHYG